MTMPDPIKPTQADRDAAADFGRYRIFSGAVSERIVAGRHDQVDLVQAFAIRAQQAREQALEEAAMIVDQCNRDGPYNAIGAATAIRALKEQRP